MVLAPILVKCGAYGPLGQGSGRHGTSLQVKQCSFSEGPDTSCVFEDFGLEPVADRVFQLHIP